MCPGAGKASFDEQYAACNAVVKDSGMVQHTPLLPHTSVLSTDAAITGLVCLGLQHAVM